MGYANDLLADNGLAALSDGTRLCLCSTLPTTFAQANVTYRIGLKDAISIGAIEDRTPNGRKRVVAAISGGDIDVEGDAAFYAVLDVANSRLLAANTLAESYHFEVGDKWGCDAFAIGYPDPA